jgi:aspartokinase-like uncharacterized kinase
MMTVPIRAGSKRCGQAAAPDSLTGFSPMTCRIVKLGGSLLDLPDVAARLRAWLARQTPADTLLIVGGGALVEEIRHSQSRRGLSDTGAHWLSIRAMAIQAEVVLALLPEARWLESATRLRDVPAAERLMVLDPWRFMREEDPRLARDPLPDTWDVTSDSIAARAAEIARATELVLLKSALPADESIAGMAQTGYVDRYFPRAVPAFARLRLVNLRDERFAETAINANDAFDVVHGPTG